MSATRFHFRFNLGTSEPAGRCRTPRVRSEEEAHVAEEWGDTDTVEKMGGCRKSGTAKTIENQGFFSKNALIFSFLQTKSLSLFG